MVSAIKEMFMKTTNHQHMLNYHLLHFTSMFSRWPILRLSNR
uniref:Uncharacterized protein n=1 Tax=Zea mays TaxID=4577 RepID=C0PJQ4_MAIZE|nr:unknown [Zea mays]